MIEWRMAFTLIAMVLLSCAEVERPPPGASRGTGSIEGSVRLSGTAIPEPTYLLNTTDPEICGRGHTLENLVIASETRGVRYAIAAIRDVPPEAIPKFDATTVVMDNLGCRFEPHAMVATVGSVLVAVNSDPVLHTTHLYGPADVNISLPVEGARASRDLTHPGLYVVKCDVHGWMQAFVRVDPHPFHAVTDDRGNFRIDGVPAGSYVLEIWHETLGMLERGVQVEAGSTASLSIEYPYPED